MQKVQTKGHIDPLNLPGFLEVRNRLESKGHPSGWITQVVDPGNPHAVYLQEGKPWYKSECPLYDGYWLHGGIGSVQCRGVDELLPGLILDTVCTKQYKQCQFYATGEVQLSWFDPGDERYGG